MNLGTRILILAACVLCKTLLNILPAQAAYDPCYSASLAVRNAQRNLQWAQNNLLRAQNDFFRAQNQVALRKGQLEAQLAQREANLNAVIASNAAWTSACIVRNVFFFRYRVGNCAFVAAGSINRRANAQAWVNTAQTNLAVFQNYSTNYLQRMAERTVVAEGQVSQAQSTLNAAEADYQQCMTGSQES